MTPPSDAAPPAPLGTKMAPLLRELERGGSMPALVATAGRETAVLVSRQAIAKPGRDLLGEYLKSSGTPRFQPGECLFEDGVLTFVLSAPADGLDKRLTSALLKQLGKRTTVRVRAVSHGSDSEPAPDSVAPSPAPAFNSRLAAMLPAVQSAIGGASPRGQQLKLIVSEAGMHARNKRFDEANALLDRADQLLASVPGPSDAPTASPAPGRRTLDEADFRRHWPRVKQAWLAALATVDEQISRLIQVLNASDDQELRDIAEFGLPAVTGDFKVPMSAAVIELEAASGAAFPAAARKLSAAARAFGDYLDREETVRVTDENEFGVTVSLRTTLGGALRDIQTLTSRVA
jgi:hypothetical protein